MHLDELKEKILNIRIWQRAGFEEWLMRYHGRPIRRSQKPDYYPNEYYINWHVREVFRGPSRYDASR